MVTLAEAKKLNRNNFIFSTGCCKIFHFGYVSGTGYLVCYTPGEENGQDAVALWPENCYLVESERKDLLDLANRR